MPRPDVIEKLINFQLMSLPTQLLCKLSVKTRLGLNTEVARLSFPLP